MVNYITTVQADTHPSGIWLVYLLLCADGSLYAGITTDMVRRLKQHNGELYGGARYTRARQPVSLVWTQKATNRAQAQQLEARVKKFSRADKWTLIKSGSGLEHES